MAAFILKPITGLIDLAFTPTVPASCLALMTFPPHDAVLRVLNPDLIRRIFHVSDAKVPFYALIALGLLRTWSRAASKAALNNWSYSPQPGWDWQAELAVVTGGCGGIGKAIVKGLVEKGVNVAIVDIQAELPEDLAKLGGKVRLFQCDLTDPDAIRATADDIRVNFGHPSILINNAGVGQGESLLDTSDDFLQKVTAVNQLALFRTTKEFLPNMILKDKGHVVNVASMASFFALPAALAYSATKSAALAFTEGLRTEIQYLYKSPGVIATVVHPSWVLTGITEPFAERIAKAQGRDLMTPERAAKPILEQIFSCRGGNVYVPGSISVTTMFRGLPNWLYGLVLRRMAMRTWTA